MERERELSGISKALATSTFLSPSTDSITFCFPEIVKHLYFLKEGMSFLSRDKSTLRMFYGPYHPTLGIHLFKIGKIQRLLGISSWIVTLQEVETILQVTHGKTHPLYRGLMKVLNNSEALPCLSTLSIEG
ncbi:histone-lysine N-methyltransferase SMYD3 [Trichonephila clavipes]|nr:histone-lysine N-methyltransferase SMYD3 [Trichonephila clavipes]